MLILTWFNFCVLKFQHSSSSNSINPGMESSDNDCYHKPQDVNYGWPKEAHYTPVLPNARNLSIREQPLPMRRTIRAAVSHISSSILFDSAYPVAEKVEFETYHRDVFVRCAKRLKYFEIVKRIKHDDQLVKLCAHIVSTSITLYVFLISHYSS